MASVTARINQIKQPRGGFIKPSDMSVELQNDGLTLNSEENVHASIIGMSVDYLTRYMKGSKLEDVFGISLRGATIAENYKVKGSLAIAKKMLSNIKGLDNNSIINACKLVTFDVWFRNTPAAMFAKSYNETNPDKATVDNIRTLVQRSLNFFEKMDQLLRMVLLLNLLMANNPIIKKWWKQAEELGAATQERSKLVMAIF